MVVVSYLVAFIHLVLCIGMIVIILVQADKTGGIQGAFGGGSSQVRFGAPGAATPIVRLTAYVAIGFMCTSLFLSYQSGTAVKRMQSHVTVDVNSIDLNLNLPQAGSKDSK